MATSPKQKAAQARFTRAAVACKGKPSRTARNACMKRELAGHGGLNDYGSPKGRSHRGGGRRRKSRRNYSDCAGTAVCR